MQISSHHYSKSRHKGSVLLLIIIGLVMIAGVLAAFFALSLLEDNDMNTFTLGKELDSIAMTGVELAAQALNQSSGGLDFLSDKDSFIFVDEDIDDDSTADGNGFGTYTAQFDETDLPLNQISEYDLIITVTRSSEISNTKGTVRTVGDPRKVIITAEVRDANDNRKRLKAVYYKPWYNGNSDDITKPQAENWFFIKSGNSSDEPVASYDSSSRGGVGEAPSIIGNDLNSYQSQSTTSGDVDEAENLHPLRIEKTAWLTEFENGSGESGSIAESGVFYRTNYDDAIHSATTYYFAPEISMPSKLARAADEVDLVDSTYENVGFKASSNLGRFIIASGTDYTNQWDIIYLPHQGFFNNYVNATTTTEAYVATLSELPSVSTVAGGSYKLSANYQRSVTFTADTTIYVTGDSNSTIRFNRGGNTISLSPGVKLVFILLESLEIFHSGMQNYSVDDSNTNNLLVVAQGNNTTAPKVQLGENNLGNWSSDYGSLQRNPTGKFYGVIYAPYSDIYLEDFAGLVIAKNIISSGVFLHDRSVSVYDVNQAHSTNLGFNPIQVDHSDNTVYPSDTTKYYLLSIEDDSGSTES